MHAYSQRTVNIILRPCEILIGYATCTLAAFYMPYPLVDTYSAHNLATTDWNFSLRAVYSAAKYNG